MKRLFVDVETTGLEAINGHRIIELAAVSYEDRQHEILFYSRFYPDRDIPEEATKVHGITDDMVRDEPLFHDRAAEIAEVLRDCELVAHNAKFDVSFLDMELELAGQPKCSDLVAKVTDSLEMARLRLPGHRHTLDALARHYQMDISARRAKHSADEDAKILAEIFQHLYHSQQALGLDENAMLGKMEAPDWEPTVVLLGPEPEADKAHADFLHRMMVAHGITPLEHRQEAA